MLTFTVCKFEGHNDPYSLRQYVARVRSRFAFSLAETAWELWVGFPGGGLPCSLLAPVARQFHLHCTFPHTAACDVHRHVQWPSLWSLRSYVLP